MKIKVINKSDYPLPRYMTDGAACMDICISNDIEIEPCEISIAHTGIFVEIPRGWCIILVERSSLHKQGLSLANSVGVIDSDYRGEIIIPLLNIGCHRQFVKAGSRVVQAMLKPIEKIEWELVNELSETERNDGGFGSTSDK